MENKIWVDLNGVLANWHKGACTEFGLEYPANTVLHREWIGQTLQMPVGALLDRLDNAPDFWTNLELMPTASGLISYLDLNFPDWGILSSATHNAQSWGGKAAWVRQYLGTKGLHRLTICCGNKARFAHPRAILIDDGAKVIHDWCAHGGQGFHWVEYTSDMLAMHQAQFGRLLDYLNTFKS